VGKTSTAAKSRYNQKAYKQFILRIRKDSELCAAVENFQNGKGSSLNYLITGLLAKHFNTPIPVPTDSESE